MGTWRYGDPNVPATAHWSGNPSPHRTMNFGTEPPHSTRLTDAGAVNLRAPPSPPPPALILLAPP